MLPTIHIIPNDWISQITELFMYPPQMDSLRKTSRADVKQFVSRGHNTLMGDNGTIAIQLQAGKIVFTKAGAVEQEIRS